MGVVLARLPICTLHLVASGGIMSTARPELPYPRVSQAKFRDETSRRESNVTFVERRDYANEAYYFLVIRRMVVYK